MGLMGVKPFRPTEGKHAEETQLRPKGRLSAFNDKKARQPHPAEVLTRQGTLNARSPIESVSSAVES
ncbi:Uncharacterized protein DBV15_03630 [Temnothorax longispinosus]|uniref:Uncharacterized protein n=1 Tax=Temnothorax longispinosus TaxID=300112 RepID=A0A4S2KKN4_9HYME|nr:Uncharacterized protein DBV15_03630 [Temnothorax longispinosus]